MTKKTKAPLVMVRGWQYVASKVHALAFDGKTVSVTGGDLRHMIGYPAHDVFVFDAKLFSELSTEVLPERRAALWEHATRFNPETLPRLPKGTT